MEMSRRGAPSEQATIRNRTWQGLTIEQRSDLLIQRNSIDVPAKLRWAGKWGSIKVADMSGHQDWLEGLVGSIEDLLDEANTNAQGLDPMHQAHGDDRPLPPQNCVC